MIGLISIIAIGFFLGMRHATDPDHVIAVTTIVTQQRSAKRAAMIGIFWGVGHTLTIFLVGCAIILFNLVIPARLGLAMEFSVSLMLILLGGWNLASFKQAIPGSAGADREHDHSHDHPHSHETLDKLDRKLGQRSFYQLVRPLMVGIVHGLAGSAAVALLILATIRNANCAIVYLLVFGVGTIAGMMVITMSIASALRFVGDRFQVFGRRLALVSGIISVAFGLVLAYQICVVQGLFGSAPHWTPH
ncbi:high-affinity nickel-transporter [Candidatus Koribacter versatilis Ellin345]|uniref:Nickel/cobalt efflux system n=1 Tax=Koribacter versatilis (strain Ellin345) TaxID=204669 RepID=Q1IT74_KORVE|nr:nickel transporter [Candidatus Koribacter versatilis]ABF39926.1 high-affinity nickel-transporter [Candidatus Koribacter versatilis Ellin345]